MIVTGYPAICVEDGAVLLHNEILLDFGHLKIHVGFDGSYSLGIEGLHDCEFILVEHGHILAASPTVHDLQLITPCNCNTQARCFSGIQVPSVWENRRRIALRPCYHS